MLMGGRVGERAGAVRSTKVLGHWRAALTRQQIGITEAMVRTYGDAVFELSHNLQTRRGDPVRERDFAAVERQRAATGLSDAQIAARIGLTRDQALYIRNLMERRRFCTGHYQRLLELGGGRRYREERFMPHEDRPTYSEAALALRAATQNFDPARARVHIDAGWWGDDTLAGWLARWAADAPDRPAIRAGDTVVSYGALADEVARLAGALEGLGIGRGDVVAVQLPNVPAFITSYLAISQIGAVMASIHMPYRASELQALLAHSRARAAICVATAGDYAAAAGLLALRDNLPALDHVIALGEPVDGALSFAELAATGPARTGDPVPVASDPFLLLYTSGTTSEPKGVPLNYHTMLSNTRAGIGEHGVTGADIFLSAAPLTHLFGLYSLHLALGAGAGRADRARGPDHPVRRAGAFRRAHRRRSA